MNNASRYVVILGAFIVIAGSFLPWITVKTPFGTVSENGTEGDGVITLFLGVLMAGSALINFRKAGSRAWLAVLFAVFAVGLGVYEFMDITGDIVTSSISDIGLKASVGTGVYLVIVGGFMGLIGLAPNKARVQVEGSKLCPQCAESVKAAASVCRYCGHQFEDEG
jgi:hypothetical protein